MGGHNKQQGAGIQKKIVKTRLLFDDNERNEWMLKRFSSKQERVKAAQKKNEEMIKQEKRDKRKEKRMARQEHMESVRADFERVEKVKNSIARPKNICMKEKVVTEDGDDVDITVSYM